MKPVLFIAFLSIFGKEPSDNGIPYRTLSWHDFRRPAPADSLDIDAVTTSELIFDYEGDNEVYKFKVTALFLPDWSWVRIKNDAVLRHEQTHFSIAYLMALKCNRELAPLQGSGEDAVQKARSLYDHYFQAMNDMNSQFDRETNLSRNRKVEGEWETRITVELNQLTSYGRNR